VIEISKMMRNGLGGERRERNGWRREKGKKIKIKRTNIFLFFILVESYSSSSFVKRYCSISMVLKPDWINRFNRRPMSNSIWFTIKTGN
jgi:hypothetical protein